ncbi:MAG: histidine phosphatase family protein [Deltaproteobacteria bacterium]|nr:histidine phosphatase family protein [Deltaproteobacteria bacterium]
MRLIIVRHGETVANILRIIQGQRPGELSSRGRLQARLLGERLGAERIDRLWSSPLARAADTAAAIACHHELPLCEVPELMERHFGILEGQSFDDYFLALERSGLPFHRFRPAGGESLEDVEQRLSRVVARLQSFPPEKTLLIAAHSVINKMLLKILLGKSYEDWEAIHQDNGCVNILESRPGGNSMEGLLLNCTRHLAAAEGGNPPPAPAPIS